MIEGAKEETRTKGETGGRESGRQEWGREKEGGCFHDINRDVFRGLYQPPKEQVGQQACFDMRYLHAKQRVGIQEKRMSTKVCECVSACVRVKEIIGVEKKDRVGAITEP